MAPRAVEGQPPPVTKKGKKPEAQESAAEAESVEDGPAELQRPVNWTPGMDVHHTRHGDGWVWGSGLGRVTVRFETRHTPPGPVLTFAAGMQGADFSVLDAIGQAGGGDCDPAAPGFACDLTANSGAFAAALGGIRDRTRTQTRIERRTETERQRLPCEWEMPAPPPGASLEPSRVNVRLTLPDGSPESLAQVPGAAGCGDAGGWFYDDALAPSRVLACPATCQTLEAAPETRVDVLFGCRTVLR